MAVQWYLYTDDADTGYGISLTDAQQAIYAALGRTLPTAYATLALLQAAIPAALPYPAGLQSRYVNITSPFFGNAQMVVLSQADLVAVYPTGTAPLPEAPFAFTDAPFVAGASGESRLSN